MPTRRKTHYPVRLPATPCSEEMLQKMNREADRRGVSLAEVQRDAFALFLKRADRKTIDNDPQSIAINEPDLAIQV